MEVSIICSNCGALISQKALFCSKCGKRQATTLVSPLPDNSSTQPSSQQTPVFSPSPSPQNKQQTFIEQEVRHQQELAQLQDELNRQFVQKYDELTCRLNELEKKVPPEKRKKNQHSQPPTLVKLSPVEKTIYIILLISLTLGLLWLLHGLYTGYLTHQTYDLQIVGGVLTMLGTLYLAYDVMGRLQSSSLAWITIFISFWFIGVLILEPVALLAAITTAVYGSQIHDASQAQVGLEVAFLFLLMGGLVAAWSGTLVGIPAPESGKKKFSWKGFLIGGLSGCLYWLIFLVVLYEAFEKGSGNQPLLLENVVTTISAGLAVALLGGFRHLIAGSNSPEIRLRSRRGCLSGLVVGSIIAIASFSPLVWYNFQSGMSFQNNVPYGILFLVIFAIIGGITGTIGRYIYWRMRTLEDLALGAFGLMLIFLATVVICIDPLSHILGGK